MLKIEIKTGNAAFCDPFTGEPNEFDEAIECKRLLEDICRKLEDGATSGNIIDINGNKQLCVNDKIINYNDIPKDDETYLRKH